MKETITCKFCGKVDHWSPARDRHRNEEFPCTTCGEMIHMHDANKYGAKVDWKAYERSGEDHIATGKHNSGGGVRTVTQVVSGGLSAEQVSAMINKEVEPVRTGVLTLFDQIGKIDERIKALDSKREIVVKSPEIPKGINLGIQHKQLEEVMQAVVATRNITACTPALSGPAGGGKTTIFKSIFKALGVPCYSIAMSPQSSESKIIGFNGPNGWVDTVVRQAYENGGGLIIDEFDAGTPGANVVFNSLLDNDQYTFGDRVIEKHPNFIPVVTMNTWGFGQDADYVGRNALDGATRDRLDPMVFFEYDWDLTVRIGADKKVVNYVANVFEASATLRLRYIFGPRKAIGASAMLPVWGWDKAIDSTIWAGVKKDDRKQIEANMGKKEFV